MRDRRIPVAALPDSQLELVLGRGGGSGSEQRCPDQSNKRLSNARHHSLPSFRGKSNRLGLSGWVTTRNRALHRRVKRLLRLVELWHMSLAYAWRSAPCP